MNQSSGQYQTNSANGSTNNNDKFRLLSMRGSALVDARTNTLIIRETAKRLEEMKQLIRKLDVQVRQVMIESRIVIANNDFARTLGVRFGVAGKTVHVNNGTGPVGSVNNLGGATGSINGTAVLNDALVDLAATNPYGALGMTLARGADYVLNLEISALQDQGLGELLSNPRVMTSDRCRASIKQGTQIPYRVAQAGGGGAGGTAGAYTVEFKDATLTLDVTPQITPSGSVVMALKVSKDAPGAQLGDSGVAIDTRQLETNVHVMDGETVVLGGIFEGTQTNNTNKVPFFSDLPGIGFLFKRTIVADIKKELLIFITPKVVKDNLASN